MEEYQEYLRRIKQQYINGAPAPASSASDRFHVQSTSADFQNGSDATPLSSTTTTLQRTSLSPSRRYQPQPQQYVQQHTPAHHQAADRSQLLRLLEQPLDHEMLAPTSSSLIHSSLQDGKHPSSARYHKEILVEVEKLSSTITTMQRERTEIEANFSQKLRDVRREIDEKESRAQELEARVDDLINQESELKSQLVATKRDTLRYQRECEMYRQQVLLHTDQQQQLQQALRDGVEREKLVVAQEQCMRELEVRYESATTTAREYEQRFLRLQQHQQSEVHGQTLKETQWREMMSTIAGALLLLVREVEDTTVRLVTVGGDATQSRGSSQSPSRRSLSFQTDRSASEFDELHNTSGEGNASRNIERALEAMEAALGTDGADQYPTSTGRGSSHNATVGFRRARELFSEAIQVHCRRFGRAMGNIATIAEEQRSRFSKSSSEVSRLEETLGRAEASAAASGRENTQLRRERQELMAAIEKHNRESAEMKSRILELVAEAEKRESSNSQHAESLKQLIEGADLDLHRYRMRVNELEALNTRTLSQKALAEEEHRSTVQQLRQSVVLKDSQVAKLRADLEQQRFRGGGGDLGSSMVDHLSADGVDIQHRSISGGLDHQSMSGAQSVVGTSFLRQQNQQLAAHIEALQRRMERMKDEKDVAVRALERHREDDAARTPHS
jgi:hypothetical protein